MPVKACAPMCTNWCTQRGSRRGSPSRRRDVAGELAGVGEDGVAADLAVVRDVHVGHDPVVVAQARDAGVLRRAAVDACTYSRMVLPSPISTARGLARVLLVLRRPRRSRRSGRCGCRGRCACARRSPRARRSSCPRRSPRARRRREYGPTSTSGGEPRAGCDDRASGWIRPLMRRPAARCSRIVGLGRPRSPSTRATHANLPMPRSRRSSFDLELELVAGHHRPLEARVVDADEVVHRLARRACVPAALQRRARRRPAPSPRGSAPRA